MLAAVMANLEFDPLMAPLGAAVIAAVLAAVVFAVHRWRPPPMARGRRAVLLVLRLVVAAAVLALLLRPVVRWQSTRPVPGEVAVVIDASRSMGIRDAGDGADAVTRAEAVHRAFAGGGNPYADLAARAVVRPYAFGSSLRPADRFSAEPVDPRTDPAEALDLLARAAARETPGSALPRLAAVILVSDGRENRRQGEAAPAARRLAERGVTVHALGVGSPQATDRVRDVAVHDLRAPERVFAGNRPEVRGAVATLGLKGRAIEAVLTVDGKEADRRRLTPDANRTTQELVFTPVLEKPGLARVALAVEPVDGELILTNNRAATGVRVEQGGIRVLYLDGRLHPENKYVARVLGGAKELLVDRRILVGGGAPGPADLDAFNVVILGDLAASALPAATVARLAERVRVGRLGLL
ncbi:MAG: VWA domain-containing protein, partial [Planctomycetes bacterium]|nr:VWA domain-containing protein [Planctomycetota bacterium]